jgi:hypothetical protein
MSRAFIPDSSPTRTPAGEHRDVLQHRLAAVAEARRLDGHSRERAPQLVHDERGERLALDVLGDHEEALARLRHLLEQREEVLHHGDLLLVQQDQRSSSTASIFGGSVTKYGEM